MKLENKVIRQSVKEFEDNITMLNSFPNPSDETKALIEEVKKYIVEAKNFLYPKKTEAVASE